MTDLKLYNRHTLPKEITDYQYIGRGTPWGNPFIVGEEYTQAEAAQAYREKLARALAGRDPKATKLVLDLVDKRAIVCSCTPRPCHGDCFVEIWNLIRGHGVKPLEGIRLWVKENGYDFGPDTDGKTHINIYSKAATKLGKFLTNMANVPVSMGEDGVFESMEGYWYWLMTGRDKQFFQMCNCFEAKKHGRQLPRNPPINFQAKFKEAMKMKIDQYPRMKELLIKSELPFTHYYFYGDDDRTVVFPPFDWITREWERLRLFYKGQQVSCIIAGSRDIEDMAIVEKAIKDSGFEFNTVICGEAKGVDNLGKRWAIKNKKYIQSYFPNWDTEGKKAGIIRNTEMGDIADMAIVIIKDNSKGSTHMAEYMKKLGKPLYVVNI